MPTIPELHLDSLDGPMDLLLDLAGGSASTSAGHRAGPGRGLVERRVTATDKLAGRVTLDRQAG